MRNRSKAAVGYAIYVVGKPVAKRAAKRRARRLGESATKPRTLAVAAAALTAVGGLVLWRRRRGAS